MIEEPSYELAKLEDKIAPIYWEKVVAERKGRIRKLRKMANEYKRRFQECYAVANRVGPRTQLGALQVAVGNLWNEESKKLTTIADFDEGKKEAKTK